MKVIQRYKNMSIFYDKNNNLCFGNKSFTSYKPISILSAKNRITRYINKLSNKDKARLKYINY